jgi:lipoprotein-releasing system ATP-binding protein
MNDGHATALRLTKVTRAFEQSGAQLEILRGADCAVHPGELVALVGPSGAGKSTLLHIAGLLERPTSGGVEIAGIEAGTLDDRRRTALRRDTIGFVYQFHRLLPEFSALENVVVPQMIAGISRKVAGERAQALLDRVGLGSRATHRPGKLSGGEQQRVAIARALANGPALLLADEPTGNLDPQTAEGVFAVLRELIAETKLGALIATHNLDLARRMDRVIELRDGLLIDA